MVEFLLGICCPQEVGVMKKIAQNLAAKLSEDDWSVFSIQSRQQLEAFFKDGSLLDIACLDVAMDGGIELAEKARASFENMWLVVVAETNMSPITYLKPSILAASLVLRPISPCQVEQAFSETIQAYLHNIENSYEENIFTVNTQKGKHRVPYNQIMFFEARQKKIILCTVSNELEFYSTMDALSEQLPEIFVRCHRGFIVNKSKISKVQLSKNLIELDDTSQVPLSRSYKNLLKEI